MKAASEIHEWEFSWLGKHTDKSSPKRDSDLPGTLSPQQPLSAPGSGQSLQGEGAILGRVSVVQAGARVSAGAGGLRACARRAAASPAARRLLTERQTKDFASRSRCLRCCKLGSSSLAAAGPAPPWRQGSVPAPCPPPPGGVSFCVPGSPCRAGRLPQEDGSPLRNRAADGTRSAIGRAEGGAQARGQPGARAPPPLAALAVWGTEVGASVAPGYRGGARRRGRGRSRQPHGASAAADLPGGARLQHPRRVGCEGSGVLGEGAEGGDAGGQAIGDRPQAARTSTEAELFPHR